MCTTGYLRGALLASVMALAAACAGYYEGSPSRTPGEIADDAAIQAAVKVALLRDPDIEGLAIDTEVRRGIVTLYGRVASEALRQRAIEIARGVEGVEGVDARIVIVP